MSSPETGATPIDELVATLYAEVDGVLVNEGTAGVGEEAIQRLLMLGVKLYAARCAETGEFPVGPDGTITATEVAVTTQGLLQVAGLDLFELSLWRQWGRV